MFYKGVICHFIYIYIYIYIYIMKVCELYCYQVMLNIYLTLRS